MLEVPKNKAIPAPDPARPGADRDFGTHVDTGRHGLLRRLLTTSRHAWGLAVGSLVAHVRALPKSERWRFRYLLLRPLLAVVALPIDRKLKRQPFEVQLRHRLRTPRTDLHQARPDPQLARGPAAAARHRGAASTCSTSCRRCPTREFFELVKRHLGRPVEEVFAHIRTRPLGSASIGQTHLADAAFRRAGDPQGGQAGDPQDAEARHAAAQGPRLAAPAGRCRATSRAG